jgi:benzodiazapine receptor
MFNKHPVVRLITAFTLCLLAAYADLYLFLPTITTWYGSLQKPSFVPSVTIIYYGIIAISLLMACGLYIIWNAAQKNRDARLAIWLVLFGLILNVSWFFVFFWVKSVFFSMVVMAILLTVIAAVIYQSLRSVVLAVLFMIPYFIIMLFATYTNVMIYLMNPNLPLLGFVP